MLIAVVKNCDFGAKVLDRIASSLRAFRTDEHGDIRQMLGKHIGFVARLRCIHVKALTVGDNADFAVPLGAVTAV